jgi:hypothetical protein
MAGVLIHDVSGYTGEKYNLKIPSLTDPANIQEAMMLFHYGIDNYDGSVEPAIDSVFGNLRDFDDRIAGLELTEVVQLDGTENQIVSSGSVGFVTLSLPEQLIAPGTFEVSGSSSFVGNVLFQNEVVFDSTAKYAQLVSPSEKLLVIASAANSAMNIDLLDATLRYFTVNATGNFTFNFRGDGSNTLNSILSVGETITSVILVTNGATPRYATGINIDGSSATIKWQGGSAPIEGNANSIDSYSFTIIKTGSATFTVLGSQTQFA